MSIVSQVQILLNDTGVFWPVPNVLDAINEAQLWVFAQTKWARVGVPLNVTVGQDIVPIPSQLLITGWIEGTKTVNTGNATLITSVRFFPTTQRELEHFLRTWRGHGLEEPGYFVLWDASHFRLFPRPDQAYTFTIWGIGYPTEIVDITSDIVGPPNYVQAIQNYTVALLLEATRPDLADVYMQIAEDQIIAFRKQLRNHQSHNIRRLRPGKRFDLQQSGTIRELPTYYPLET
jgi:hypothetical protein